MNHGGSPIYERLPTSVYLGYGVGSVGTGLYSALPSLLLLFFMTDTLGIPAGLAGLGVFAPKLWDVVTDPMMGALSDRTRSSWGRRRPYLLAGSLTLPVFLAMLFSVPGFESTTASFLYVTVLFVLCATSYTLFQVPYIAMPAEMTEDYNERTTIMSFRMAFMTAGILVAGGAAPVLVNLGGGGRAGYSMMAIVMAAVCCVVMLASFFGTRRAPFSLKTETTMPFSEQLSLALKNTPFFILLIGYFPQQVAVGCMIAALPYYVTYVLKGSEFVITIIFIALVLPAIFTMPIWVRISRRIGKLWSFMAASSLFAVMALSMLFGGPDTLGLLYVQVAVMGAGYAGIQLFPFSMLPDTIQADRAASGLRREGIFTGVWTAAEKTGMAAGALLAGTILGGFGFIETAEGRTAVQSVTAIRGIFTAFILAPSALLVLSLPVIWRYPLSGEALREMTERTEG